MKKPLTTIFLYLAMASLSCFTKSEYANVVVFHENERTETLDEIGAMIDSTSRATREFFGMEIPRRTLYVYANQKEMQRQRHPVAATILRLDWYIGDNIGERALIVSPNTPLKVHSYRSVMNAIPHEYVHTVVYAINPRCPLWVNEGLALYLTNGNGVSLSRASMPPKRVFTSDNPLYFEKHNGYFFADKFIEFLERAYGHESVLALARTGDYGAVAGKGLDRLYDEWADYLKKNYP